MALKKSDDKGTTAKSKDDELTPEQVAAAAEKAEQERLADEAEKTRQADEEKAAQEQEEARKKREQEEGDARKKREDEEAAKQKDLDKKREQEQEAAAKKKREEDEANAKAENERLEQERRAKEEETGKATPKKNVQELILVESKATVALRQPSTGKWIEAGGQAHLLDDGWLANQVRAKLLKKVK